MKITETNLKGCFVLEPTVFKDKRGVFFESYHKERFERAIDQKVNFIQSNHSVSKKGVLRGLHFQKGIYSQAKLVQVIKGQAVDVVVDIRKQSQTFGQHIKIRLGDYDKKLLFIPKGMAHGFLALTEEVIFTYKCDNYYHKESEAGIKYNDPDLNIDWEIDEDLLILSSKDMQLPLWKGRKI